MSAFGEFKWWNRAAPGAEKALAVVAASLALALLGWAAVPASDAEPETALQAADASAVVAAAPGSATSSAASVPATDTTTPALGSTVAAGSPAQRPGAAGQTARRPAGATAPSEPLRASDRGVTATQLKLGFVMFDIGGLRATGFNVIKVREDVPQVIDALVDWANDNGGVAGRKIVGVKKLVSLIDPNDQRAKCLDYTQRDKVFAVLDSFTYIFPATRACLTVENKTPYFTAWPGGAREVAKAAPYQVSTNADNNVHLKNWVMGARDAGFFKASNGFAKLGILSDNCDRSIFDGSSALKGYLKAAGVTSWSEFVADCDVTGQQSAGLPAVLQHRRDGVTHVLLTTFSTGAAAYTDAAAAQGFKPKYFVGDLNSLSWDGSTPDFDPDQWNAVRGVTASRSGELKAGKPLSPQAKACSKILTDRGLAPIREYNADFEAWLLCEHLMLFLKGSALAPRNLTRADWGVALQRLGDFESAFFSRTRFEPGVVTGGGRTLASIEWRKGCACYHQVSGFRASYR